MGHIDEAIVEGLNAHKKGSYGNIEDGFYVKEEKITFKRVSLFDGRMSVMMPETFIDLPQAIVKLKYPSEQRPKIIKSTKDGGTNLTFNLVDEVSLLEEDVTYLTDSMKNGLKAVNPALNIGEEGIMEVADTTLSWFEFQNNAFDGVIYNLMYCLPVDGKMMHGIFNCLIQDKEAWREVAFAIMQTIQDETRQQ